MVASQASSRRRPSGAVMTCAGYTAPDRAASPAERALLPSARSERLDRLLDAALAGLGRLRLVDGLDDPPLVAVRQLVVGDSRDRVGRQERGELGWKGDDALLRVELELDVDDLASRDPGRRPDVRADADHRLPVDRGDAAAVHVPVEGDLDGRFLAGR